MEHATQVELIKRGLHNMASRTRDMVDHTGGTPTEEYFSAERYRAECLSVFRKYPLIVAHSSQLNQPGDYLAHDDSGVPILLVRKPDGGVEAFLNICRHRCARLVNDRCGNTRTALTCPYHAWTYDLNGRLTGLPQDEGFEGVDVSKIKLTTLPVEEKYGFIWVVPTPGATIDIQGYIGDFAKDFASYESYNHELFPPEKWTQKMNWKALVDTFLESYHFEFLHPKSVGPLFQKNNIVFDQAGPHLRIVTMKKTLPELEATDPANWTIRGNAILLYLIFPNTVLNWTVDHLQMYQTFPKTPEESVMWMNFFTEQAPAKETIEKHWRKNWDLSAKALVEDFEVGEGMQRNFRASDFPRTTFGRYEQALEGFHRSVDEAVAKESV